MDSDQLPEAWRLANQRDRQGPADYADPAPERQAARALAAFILAGLAFLALPGTFLGVWNLIVISEHRAATAGVAWRWWAGIGEREWRLGLVGSATLELAAYVLTQRVLVFRGGSTRKKPNDLGSWLGICDSESSLSLIWLRRLS